MSELDTARMDALEAYLDRIEWAHDAGEPQPVLVFFVGDGGGDTKVRGCTIREAVDRFRLQCADSVIVVDAAPHHEDVKQ